MRAIVLVLLALTGPPEPVEYRPPVEAPVIDAFRPPATSYGPGNRGLEYAVEPGTPVRSAAPGAVVFAGSVAGDRYVTVQHGDRLRTTYGPLAQVAVAAGEQVDAGDTLGASGARLLWTARLGDAYLDPAVLLAASGAPHARLVPDRSSPAGHRRREASPPAGALVSRGAAEWALGR